MPFWYLSHCKETFNVLQLNWKISLKQFLPLYTKLWSYKDDSTSLIANNFCPFPHDPVILHKCSSLVLSLTLEGNKSMRSTLLGNFFSFRFWALCHHTASVYNMWRFSIPRIFSIIYHSSLNCKRWKANCNWSYILKLYITRTQVHKWGPQESYSIIRQIWVKYPGLSYRFSYHICYHFSPLTWH